MITIVLIFVIALTESTPRIPRIPQKMDKKFASVNEGDRFQEKWLGMKWIAMGSFKASKNYDSIHSKLHLKNDFENDSKELNDHMYVLQSFKNLKFNTDGN